MTRSCAASPIPTDVPLSGRCSPLDFGTASASGRCSPLINFASHPTALYRSSPVPPSPRSASPFEMSEFNFPPSMVKSVNVQRAASFPSIPRALASPTARAPSSHGIGMGVGGVTASAEGLRVQRVRVHNLKFIGTASVPPPTSAFSSSGAAGDMLSRSAPVAGPVRRSLFGAVDAEQLKNDLDAEMAQIAAEKKAKWNFDFATEEPLEGQFEWKKVEEKEQEGSAEEEKETEKTKTPAPLEAIPAMPFCARSAVPIRVSRHDLHRYFNNKKNPVPPTSALNVLPKRKRAKLDLA